MNKEEKVACYVRVSSNKQAKEDRYSIPYGYELDEEDRLIINQEEARVIRLIFDLIANQGWSCYKVPEKLNAMGIPTRFKKLGRVLKSNKLGRVYE